MKLIIQEIINARRILLCFLLITMMTSSIKSLKSNNFEASIYSDTSDEIESNRMNNQTNIIKNANLKINFKFANVSLVFPHPVEQFRLSYNELDEETRKSINPLLIPNNTNNDKGNSKRNFLSDNSDNNNFNSTSSRITVNDKNEKIRCNYLFILFLFLQTQSNSSQYISFI